MWRALARPMEPNEAALAGRDVERLSGEASRIVRRALAALPQEDRAIVRMHFGSGTSVADISRMLRVPQRPLYRRIETSLAHLRRALVAAGIDALTAEGLIGSAVQALDFGLQGGKATPAGSQMKTEGRTPAATCCDRIAKGSDPRVASTTSR